MSRESFDIVDKAEHAALFVPTTISGPRCDTTQREDQPDRNPPLGVQLTGYRLLNIAVILAFGIPKAMSSYSGQTTVPTTLEWVSGTLLAIILYYVGLFQDKRPEICLCFFQVDWAPLILKFVFRLEVYHFFLSILPLRPAVVLLKVALASRRAASLKGPSSDSRFTIGNALVVATVGLTLGVLTTLRQFTIVIRRFEVLRPFLEDNKVLTTLAAAWSVLCFYVVIVGRFMNVLSTQDIGAINHYFFGHFVGFIPFLLLWPMTKTGELTRESPSREFNILFFYQPAIVLGAF